MLWSILSNGSSILPFMWTDNLIKIVADQA